MFNKLVIFLIAFGMILSVFGFSQENVIKREQQELVQYISYKEIFPGQTRYSSQNVAQKVDKLIAKKAATWNEAENQWNYKYNQGTSLLSQTEALPVIRAPFGYVLIDGHHDVLSSIHLKAEMIPIKMIEDLSHLNVNQFWKVAEQKGWVYLYSLGGEKASPCVLFDDLIDDSNRSFAALISHIFYPNENGSYSSRGAEYPVWIKVGKDTPFIEFKIADALFVHGFVYEAEQMGNPPSTEVVEQARQILLEANIPGLRVVSNRIHYEQIKLNCESLDCCRLLKQQNPLTFHSSNP